MIDIKEREKEKKEDKGGVYEWKVCLKQVCVYVY